MVRRKPLRTRGKIQLSRYFQNIKEGDYVGVKKEMSVNSSFPKSISGRTGIVKEKRGRNFVIKMKDGRKEKEYIIHPIHLKKIKTIEK